MTCKDCKHFKHISKVPRNGDMGSCGNEESSHFGHVLVEGHECKEIDVAFLRSQALEIFHKEIRSEMFSKRIEPEPGSIYAQSFAVLLNGMTITLHWLINQFFKHGKA